MSRSSRQATHCSHCVKQLQKLCLTSALARVPSQHSSPDFGEHSARIAHAHIYACTSNVVNGLVASDCRITRNVVKLEIAHVSFSCESDEAIRIARIELTQHVSSLAKSDEAKASIAHASNRHTTSVTTPIRTHPTHATRPFTCESDRANSKSRTYPTNAAFFI